MEGNNKLMAMEEGRNRMSREERDEMADIWNKAITTNKSRKKFIGIPSKKLNDAIGQALKTDVDIKEQRIALEQVRHIRNKHGEGNERSKGLIPVTKEIFSLIPDILRNFDYVERGTDTKKAGKDVLSVRIIKHYSEGDVAVADAIIDGNILEIKTMWVKKPKPTGFTPQNAKAPSDSPLSPSPSDLTEPRPLVPDSHGTRSASINNISDSGKNVNTQDKKSSAPCHDTLKI